MASSMRPELLIKGAIKNEISSPSNVALPKYCLIASNAARLERLSSPIPFLTITRFIPTSSIISAMIAIHSRSKKLERSYSTPSSSLSAATKYHATCAPQISQ